ncbi:hypothetical protein HanPI659440_Chr07g0255811 [Helianthus annuus]|nr:hypothetical protein HanPI659440_Chr07g0255811 [Helianthus annuus]
MCLLVTFMLSCFHIIYLLCSLVHLLYMIPIHFMLRTPIVCILSTSLYNTFHATYAHCVHTLYITLQYISCNVRPLCAYLVHHFTIHFMLRTPIVCILSTLFYIAFLLHMLIQHMNSLYYILNRCNHLTM